MRPSTSRPVRAVATLLAALLAVGAAATDDPFRPQQWGLDRVRAEQAWSVSRGTGVVVAVIDSGVDLGHPDLETQLHRDGDGRVVGADYVDGDADPTDRNGHGTMVAGIAAAAADNGIGIAGVAPGARIMPIRVLDDEGRGTPSDVDDAIRWAVDNGADVINLSLESEVLAGEQRLGVGVAAPVAAVRYAWDRGVPVVAAAGNSGNPFTDYPPTSPVLLVGASDRDDDRAGFSDAGRDDAVLAPGVEIVSTWCRHRPGTCETGAETPYGQADGTSFAAPSVTAVVALLLGTGLDHEDAVARVRSTARDVGPPGPDRQHGHGIVDAAAAVAGLTGADAPSEDVREPTPPSTPTSDAPASPPTSASSPAPSPPPSSAPAEAPSAPPAATGPPPGGEVGTPTDETPADGGAVVADPAAPPVAVQPPRGADPGPLRALAAMFVVISAAAWWRVHATGAGARR